MVRASRSLLDAQLSSETQATPGDGRSWGYLLGYDDPMGDERDLAGRNLTELEIGVLEFERQWWRLPIAKEQAIRARFHLSGPQYYQILNTLIDRQEAMAADPLLVKRLRRLRTQRRQERYLVHARSDVCAR
jgi:hypothetical protein